MTASRGRPPGTTARVVQDMFRTLYEQGRSSSSRRRSGRSRPRPGSTLPDRYIEGTCPICGYGEARGDQCDNCGNQLDPVDLIDPRSVIDGSTPEFRETKHLFLDLPSVRASGSSSGSKRRRTGGPNVRNFSLNLARRAEAARDDPRHRLGRSGSGARAIAEDDEAHLRLVRRGDRLPLRHRRVGAQRRPARGVARVVAEPGRAQLLLHGEGQHRLPHGDLAEHADGLRRGRRARRRQGRSTSVRRRRERVPDDEGSKSSTSRGHRDLGQGLRSSRYEPDPLRYYLTAAGPETQDSDFTWEEFVRRNERRAARQLGQPRQPDARRTRTETSAPCRSRAS